MTEIDTGGAFKTRAVHTPAGMDYRDSRIAVSPPGAITMTVTFSHHSAGSALRCVLVLVAVMVSSLCMAGGSAAESVRPSQAASGTQPTTEPLTSEIATEQDGTEVREAVDDPQGAAGFSPVDTGHCDKQAATDTASARDGSRPYAPLPTPVREERWTPVAQAGPGPASGGPGPAPPAPELVQLSVLRI